MRRHILQFETKDQAEAARRFVAPVGINVEVTDHPALQFNTLGQIKPRDQGRLTFAAQPKHATFNRALICENCEDEHE